MNKFTTRGAVFTKNTMKFTYRIEWQTPDKYIQAARDVMGEIDLDPISSDRANERIKAEKYYTVETNGLAQRWSGRMWINPAYEILPECVQKLIDHYSNGDLEQALIITHTLTTWEPWFQDLLLFSDSFCFVAELVPWYPGHTPDLPQIRMLRKDPVYDTRGSIVAYFGPNKDRFSEVFKKFGAIK